jgi:peptidoglycan hydrolase-like protein with peptidoglycan-binding domain
VGKKIHVDCFKERGIAKVNRISKAVRILVSLIIILWVLGGGLVLMHRPMHLTTFANTTPTLKLGMSGEVVASLQKDLTELGYFKEEVTGYFGTLTQRSVKDFQKEKGLVIDGIAGAATRSAILSLVGKEHHTLKYGDFGQKVSNLQQKLKDLGFFHQEKTGYYGNVTTQSVLAFQKLKGLLEDGIAGAQTQKMLFGIVELKSSRGNPLLGELITWYNEGENIFALGTIATVTDVITQKKLSGAKNRRNKPCRYGNPLKRRY